MGYTPATVVDTNVKVSHSGKHYIWVKLEPFLGSAPLYGIMAIIKESWWNNEKPLRGALNEYEWLALGLGSPDLSTPDKCFDLATEIAQVLIGKVMLIYVHSATWKGITHDVVRWL